jgi:phage-related protein
MANRYDDWLWWRASDNGRAVALAEFESFAPDVLGAMLEIMNRWLTGDCMEKEFSNLGKGLWELRYRVASNHYRVLFCVEGRNCVVLTCFYKNQQRTPKPDLDRARKRMRTGTCSSS